MQTHDSFESLCDCHRLRHDVMVQLSPDGGDCALLRIYMKSTHEGQLNEKLSRDEGCAHIMRNQLLAKIVIMYDNRNQWLVV